MKKILLRTTGLLAVFICAVTIAHAQTFKTIYPDGYYPAVWVEEEHHFEVWIPCKVSVSDYDVSYLNHRSGFLVFPNSAPIQPEFYDNLCVDSGFVDANGWRHFELGLMIKPVSYEIGQTFIVEVELDGFWLLGLEIDIPPGNYQ